MKKTFLMFVMGAGSLFIIASCNDSGTEKTSTSDTASITSAGPTVPDTMRMATNNDFVTKAAQAGMEEVELGKMAQTNGSSKDVKDFGKMMEADHSKANAELQSIASTENIIIPSAMEPATAAHVKDMEAMKGAGFDKHYISMMVDGHNKVLEEFKTAAASNPNQKVKDFAARTIPVIEGHLAKAKTIKSKMK